MNTLTQGEGLVILFSFAITMIALVGFLSRKEDGLDSFLVADRKVGVLAGSFSMAVSWMWAPAIFVCSLQAYVNGLAGIFWFTAPNILCFFVFAPFALKLRNKMPEGYTFPHYIYDRFSGNKLAHISMLLVFFGYQLCSIIMNSVAGGTLLHMASGLNITFAVIGISLTALIYSLLNGLKASIITDVLQMSMVLIIILVLVPLCFLNAGGMETVVSGLGGLEDKYRYLFHPGVAFTLGIPLTCSLIAGPFCDQQFYQRAFAVDKKVVTKTFVYAGLIFGIIPIALSLLGFLGAGMVRAGELVVSDPQMVGPAVIAAVLPKAALYAFCYMAFGGLCSTMDSTYCAVSALGGIDIYKLYFNPNAKSETLVRVARFWMFGIAIVGTIIALMQPQIMWILLIFSAMAPAVFVPAIFALYSSRITGNVVGYSVLLSFVIATPLSIYATIYELEKLVVFSALISVLIGLLFCIIGQNFSKIQFEDKTKVSVT